MEEVLADFTDVVESDVGPTRSGRCIDRVFTNFGGSVDKCGTVPPLETDDQTAKKSDHAVAYVRADLPRVAEVRWLDYMYRYFNEDSSKLFGGWLACQDWNELRAQTTSNARAEIYQREVVGAMEACFPLIKMRRKASDPPWFNAAIRKKLAQRRGVYWREGRSPKWRRLKKITERITYREKERKVRLQPKGCVTCQGWRP